VENKIQLPLSENDIRKLQAGDYVYLTGIVYTARDAAHKRMMEALQRGESLPFPIKGSIIYYMGPSPAREGRVIGSAGPTTAGRMDKYAPELMDLGMKGMIGKGRRTQAVTDAIIKNNCVYFAAVGGAGALLSKRIVSSEIIAYEDLGTEAIRKLKVEDFPVIVAIDTKGHNIYDIALEKTGIKNQGKNC
jgi:fumarate hydratase subunit beta